MKRILIITAILFTGNIAAHSQIAALSDTITWTSVTSVDMRTNEAVERGGKFITYPGNIVEMVQSKRTLTFVVTSVEGEWNNINTEGSGTLNVTFGDDTGKIIIGRNGTGLFITLDFSQVTETGMYQKFIISSYQVH